MKNHFILDPWMKTEADPRFVFTLKIDRPEKEDA